MNNLKFKLAGVCAASVLLMPTSALALDARAFADQLSATISTMGSFKLEIIDANVDGNNIVLTGLDVSGLPDGFDDKVLDTSVTFTNVAETSEGGYTADQALFENIDMNKDGVHLLTSDMSADGIQLFADSATDVLHMMKLYSAINIGPISVSFENEEVFRVDGMSVTADWNEDDSQMQSNYDVMGIYGDVAKIDDSDAEEIFGMLGLTEIRASMVGRSTWDLAEGKFSMPESSITVQDIGRLNIGMDLLGYTLAFVEKTQNLSRTLADADPEQAEMLALQTLMVMAADLSFGKLNIRFDDDSLTGKLMDFIGEEEGLSRKGMIATVAQILPAMLAELEMPDLQVEITDAVVNFLQDPQSIEIDATPPEPVPFMALMAVAQNPSIAKSMLNLSVSANQPE